MAPHNANGDGPLFSSNNTSEASALPTILQIPSPAAIREEFENLVMKDLLGPAGGPEEEVQESVLSRYLVGMLAPQRNPINPAELDDLAVGGSDTIEDGPADSTVPQIESLRPSAIGMTLTVKGEVQGFRVIAKWGRYIRTDSETATNSETGNPLKVWKRQQIEEISEPMPLKQGILKPWIVNADQPEVMVVGEVHQHQNDWIVTLFLLNNQAEPKKLRDGAWLFQAELTVTGMDDNAIFIKRPLTYNPGSMDPLDYKERLAMDMLYRHQVEFAVGHGVAVHVETSHANPQEAVRISTIFIPNHEVPRQTPPTSADNPDLTDLVLDMQELAETPTQAFPDRLGALSHAYGIWIHEQEELSKDPSMGLSLYQAAAQQAVKNCFQALERIKGGLELISTNENAAEAFRFANRAMWQQRIHSIYAERQRRGETITLAEIDLPDNRTWYPFQLAFILINLPSLTDMHHPDRQGGSQALADLLWFPTGGGKTEAYLGLAAYTLAIRRLQGLAGGLDSEHGVAVLMRYTLRVLTLQQFQRATALICACEMIRRQEYPKWGKNFFRIGLWVGGSTTPNTTDQSAEAIKHEHGQKKTGGLIGGSGSPAQLTNCPWCGTPIDPGKHIKVETFKDGRGRTLIFCGDPLGDCPFTEKQSPGEGIPVLVVDDEIYRLLPSLLIATVDKFAQMPWNGKVQMLFGRVTGFCPRHGFLSPEIDDAKSHPKKGIHPAVERKDHLQIRPPDLIIQDELHLISGPLGTLVGLYETAIDHLCSWEFEGIRIYPKIIASTATIRRALDQVHHLFLRQVEVFPPHGLDIKDNFFSLQRSPSEEFPGRKYIGICAFGVRLKAVLIRVYVTLLASGQKLYEKYGAAADPWMTLVGYFNSMRELAGMRRLVDDDVRSRLREVDQIGLSKRRAPNLRELTSRIGALGIPEILDRMENDFHPDKEKARKQQKQAGKKVTIPEPLDVLLATNMISVGVDIKRLGLMVVAGQTKTTAEYIQATSRVGRNKPGLVFTIFNWARPRDLSHYERFEHYHGTFYKHVEALSVTPFASRALDRGLTALLVSLIRLSEQEYNGNKTAQNLDRHHHLVEQALATVVYRAGGVTGIKQVEDIANNMLDHRLDQWLLRAQQAQAGYKLGYKDVKDGVTKGLLKMAGVDPWGTFTCLNSLRDVEPTVGLVLSDFGMDE